MGGSLSHKAVHFLSRRRTTSRPTQNGGVPDFDDREKCIIRSTWENLDQKSAQVASEIFLRIFELRPDVKEFFPFRSASGEALLAHPHFKGHSMRFMNAVGMTVANMNALEVIHVPNLRKLGQYHTRIPGFTHDIFEVFYEAMNDVWARNIGKGYNSETRSAWSKVFRFIVDQVEIGYHEAQATETQLEPSSGRQPDDLKGVDERHRPKAQAEMSSFDQKDARAERETEDVSDTTDDDTQQTPRSVLGQADETRGADDEVKGTGTKANNTRSTTISATIDSAETPVCTTRPQKLLPDSDAQVTD